MDPLPVSGGMQRGAEPFFCSLLPVFLVSFIVPFIVSFKLHSKMKNQITLPVSQARQNRFSLWLSRENKQLSSDLEMSVTNRQMLLMAHSVVSFSVLTCSVFLSVWSALFCLVWFAWSLLLCKKGGIR